MTRFYYIFFEVFHKTSGDIFVFKLFFYSLIVLNYSIYIFFNTLQHSIPFLLCLFFFSAGDEFTTSFFFIPFSFFLLFSWSYIYLINVFFFFYLISMSSFSSLTRNHFLLLLRMAILTQFIITLFSYSRRWLLLQYYFSFVIYLPTLLQSFFSSYISFYLNILPVTPFNG